MARRARCWRVCSVPIPQANVNEAAKVSIHRDLLKMASGQLPFLGLLIVSQATRAAGLPDAHGLPRASTLGLSPSHHIQASSAPWPLRTDNPFPRRFRR